MLIIFIRTLILYILVVLALRMMGKRQIGQLQPSELVIAMMISELACIPMENVGTPIVNGVIPIFTLIIAEAAFSFLTLKSKKIRKIISGTPTILIEKGRVLEKEMERLRFNIDDLMEELRSSGYANLLDVEYAIIETNGMLSIIPKSSKRPVTPADMELVTEYEGLPFLLVADGVINRMALKSAQLDEEWLYEKLSEFDIDKIEDVFIACLDTSGNLFVQRKYKKEEQQKKQKSKRRKK
ncbi:MAG: DUF421 domain-containing protein [Clostridia bacterium]|nr:DUF421 domain-containing protein [Clostridia bacterium]